MSGKIFPAAVVQSFKALSKSAPVLEQILDHCPAIHIPEKEKRYIENAFQDHDIIEKCDLAGLSTEELKEIIPEIDSALRLRLLLASRKKFGPSIAMFITGFSVLIQLNTFLAGAVFVGLSLATPSGDMSIQQPIAVTWDAASMNASWVAPNITLSGRKLAQTTVQEDPPELSHYERCRNAGADEKKGLMFQLQVAAFCCFLASTGMATGILMSISGEAELESKREVIYIWGAYVAVAIPMLVGLALTYISLPIMSEVMFGDIMGSCNKHALITRGIVIAIAGTSAVVGFPLFLYGFTIR